MLKAHAKYPTADSAVKPIAQTAPQTSDVITPTSIAKSSRWVLAGAILSKPIQLFTNILVARLLGPESFGALGLASSLAGTLSLVAGLGLGDAVNKYLAEYYQKDRRKGSELAAVIIWTALLFTAIFVVVLWATRSFWIGVVFPASTTMRVVSLSLCLTVGNLMFSLLLGIFSGLQRFREFTILVLMQAGAVALFAAAVAFYGTEGALLAYAGGTFVAVLWGVIKVRKLERGLATMPAFRAFRQLKTIFNFAIPIWVGAFALAPFATFTFVFLAHQPNGVYHLGIFNTANGLRMLVSVLPGAIAAVVAPAILQEGGIHGEQGAYQKLIDKSFSALIFLTLPLLIPCLFLGDLLFKLYGHAYSEAFPLFIPLSASAAIGAIGTPLTTVMMAKNRTWWGLGFGLLKSVLLVVLTLVCVPRFLGAGLTLAVVISEISLYVLVLEYCVAIGALPQRLRWTFYTATALVLMLTALAMVLPPLARWVLAAPLTAAVVIYYMRTRVETASWLASFVPSTFRPRAQRILGLITT
jgi:O-antigen/teichoic acid export membrane protein